MVSNILIVRFKAILLFVLLKYFGNREPWTKYWAISKRSNRKKQPPKNKICSACSERKKTIRRKSLNLSHSPNPIMLMITTKLKINLSNCAKKRINNKDHIMTECISKADKSLKKTSPKQPNKNFRGRRKKKKKVHSWLIRLSFLTKERNRKRKTLTFRKL